MKPLPPETLTLCLDGIAQSHTLQQLEDTKRALVAARDALPGHDWREVYRAYTRRRGELETHHGSMEIG